MSRFVAAASVALFACAAHPVVAQQSKPSASEPAKPETDFVDDAEFDAALPPLDPELNAPLQPIGDLAVEPADAAPPPGTASTPAPTSALNVQAEPIDPALAEPLPALATFDVATPVATAAADDEEATTLRYSVTVEGLDEVELKGRFRELSALEKGDGKRANGATIAARAKEDEALLARILRSEGYYDGTATSTIQQVEDPADLVRVTLTAAPGKRYAFGAIAVPGPATVPPELVRRALPLESGKPIIAVEVAAAEANVSLILPQNGYPFVEVGEREIVLDPAIVTGDYTLPVTPGPRARFGGYSTTGDLAFDAEHVGVLSRFDAGELYDSRKVDDLREALVATSLLSTVAVEPVRTGRIGPDGTETVDLLVTQVAGPSRSLSASAGFGTGQGFRLEGAWTHRNLFPPEGALEFSGVAGTQEQALGLTFRRSNAGQRDRTVLLSASASHQNYDAFEAFTGQLTGRISRASTPIWRKRWTYAFGFEAVGTNEDRFDFARGERVRDTYFIGALPVQLGYDRSDSLLDPTRGFRLLGRLSPEVSLQGSVSPYARALIEGSVYYPLGQSLVVAGRARFGTISGVGRDDIAPSRRLYGGGGGSVRGFGFQQLGPRDINDDPVGGRSLTEFALEARYRFGNFGVVPFIDAGQVTNSSMPGFSELRYGVGIGGRFYTNFGPVRVDVATPLGRRTGESIVALYISIGQAF